MPCMQIGKQSGPGSTFCDQSSSILYLQPSYIDDQVEKHARPVNNEKQPEVMPGAFVNTALSLQDEKSTPNGDKALYSSDVLFNTKL